MGLRLRYSAWTLPWLLDFKQKVASIPVTTGSGTGQVGLFTTAGRAGVEVNLAKFDRIDEVIAADEGSLIRVFDGPVIIDEWIAKRGAHDISDRATRHPLSGPALPSIFDQYLVPAFDSPANPVEQGSWQWGADNILGNPGLEDGAVTPKQFHLVITATGGTFTLTDGTDTTSAIAHNADASTISTRIQTDLGLFIDVVVVQIATSPRTFVIEMVTPAFGVNLGINAGSLTGGTGTTTTIVEGGVGISPWTKAQTLVSGLPNQGNYDTEPHATTVNPDTGTYALQIDPGPVGVSSNRNAGAQQVPSITPGLHQGSIRVRPTSASDPFRLGIFGVGEEVIAWSNPSGDTLPPNTYSTIPLADIQIPEGNSQIIFRLACTKVGPSDPSSFNLDNAELYPGLPASNAGDILTTLFDAHSQIGNWIDYSSFGATDSNGDAWPEDISFEVQWGEHFGHVLDRMVDLGYEWELVPKTTPVGTLTHDFHLYNSGGRDATYQNGGVPTTAINKGQSILGGEVVKRTPDYTSVLLEGAGGAWSKVTDATTEAQFGVLEKFVANRQLLNEATRVLAAEQVLAYEAANRRAARIEVGASLIHPRPLRAYRPGDSIPWQIPPALPKESRRVQRVDYTNTFPTRYVVTGSRVLSGDAAAFDLIWRLWRRFSRPPAVETGTVAVGGDKGGAFTIQVAASNASSWSKGKADPGFQCLGVDDHILIMEAMYQLFLAGGGELWLSEGTFSCAPDQVIVGYSTSYPVPIIMRGVGDASIIQLATTETLYGVLVAGGCLADDLVVRSAS